MVKYEDPIDLIFYGLSHPVRREILKLISTKDQLVTELAAKFEMSLPAISKHIKVLEKAELINRKKDGRVHYISLNGEAMLTAEQWLKEYRQFWNANFDKLDNYLNNNK